MVKEIPCDILESPTDVIIQCNNCFCTQGSGVAKVIRAKYPEVYEEDCSRTIKGDVSKLGTILPVKVRNPDNKIHWVYLCYAQHTYGREKRQVDYEALFCCFLSVKEEAENMDLTSIGVPYKMASNLAGGDFRIVRTMLDVVFENSSLNVLICRRPGD